MLSVKRRIKIHLLIIGLVVLLASVCFYFEYRSTVHVFGEDNLPTSLSLSITHFSFFETFNPFFPFDVYLNLSGTLKGNGVPIGDAWIQLLYSANGGQNWNEAVGMRASDDGSYSAIWNPPEAGVYLFKTTWTPYDPYENSESPVVMLSIKNFSGYVYSVMDVVSNSTLSVLDFNSTSWELSFTATGETGTAGFAEVGIAPKRMVGNISDLRVFMDGDDLDYTVKSTDDALVLHFVYTHSSHSVTIDLGISQEVSPWPSPSLSPNPTATPSLAPTPTPEPTSKPTGDPEQVEQDLTGGAILAGASIIVFLGLLFYFIKRR